MFGAELSHHVAKRACPQIFHSLSTGAWDGPCANNLSHHAPPSQTGTGRTFEETAPARPDIPKRPYSQPTPAGFRIRSFTLRNNVRFRSSFRRSGPASNHCAPNRCDPNSCDSGDPERGHVPADKAPNPMTGPSSTPTNTVMVRSPDRSSIAMTSRARPQMDAAPQPRSRATALQKRSTGQTG